ncbi:MAG TPA: type II secretion system F family protein [Thermoanaerobaculia bacterium]|nr:type II secretion system F family protein [Thermoanaerobaculia bacterium]
MSGLDVLLTLGLIAAVIWLVRTRPAGSLGSFGATGSLGGLGGLNGPGDSLRPPGSLPGRAAPAGGWRQRASSRLSGYFPNLARQAGYDPATLSGFFLAARLIFALLLPSLLIELLAPWGVAPASLTAAWLLLPALLGFVLPDLWLLGVRRRRKAKVAHSLSFFADLLVAFLHSGLSLEQAFRRAGREGFAPSHPLAREVATVGHELDAGQDPATAFRALAERTGVAELRGIASALQLGARLGTPVRTTLAAHAELLWTKRRETALKKINAAAVKVTFPVMLAGFPLFFLLTFFPAILELLDEVRAVLG